MRYIKPDYYEDFKCVAAACPDTCCAGWQIVIDEEALEKYSEVKGAFGRRLVNSIDWQEGCFYQYDGRCAFLNEENLCDLYTELGEGALCATCKNYPRHTEEYEGLRELSLSLSCPIAAKMILGQEKFPEFVEYEDEREEELAEEFEDFDLLMFTQLEDARAAVLKHLRETVGGGEAQNESEASGVEEAQNRSEASGVKETQNGSEASGVEEAQDRNEALGVETGRQGAASGNLEENMCTYLQFAREMQDCIDCEEYCEVDTVIRTFEERLQATGQGKVIFRYSHRKALFSHIYGLERLRDEWTKVLDGVDETLYRNGQEQYESIVERFEMSLKQDKEAGKRWENAGLQLFVFFFYTYFCGAVYDDRIYSKMALTVESVRFIRELYLAKWVQNGELKEKDYVEFAYRYAREIEHSDLNLNELENFAESAK